MSKPEFKLFGQTQPVLWTDPEHILSAAVMPFFGPIGLADGRELHVTEWAPVVNGDNCIRAKIEVEIHVPESLFAEDKPEKPAGE